MEAYITICRRLVIAFKFPWHCNSSAFLKGEMEEREFHPLAQAWFGEMGFVYINFVVQIRRALFNATLPNIPTRCALVCSAELSQNM